jgi:hypothetical protein
MVNVITIGERMQRESGINSKILLKEKNNCPVLITGHFYFSTMEIYLGKQAKSLFYGRDVPINSIGVFQTIGGDWLYWFNDDWTYDTGCADTEVEAMETAKRNFKARKKLNDEETI